jgi:hypothetical protein
MSPQLSLAAAASVLALAALCLNAPALGARGGDSFASPIAAMSDARMPALPLPSLLPR